MGAMNPLLAAQTVIQLSADGVDVSLGEEPAKALAVELFRLRTELAEAKRDTERLDWMDAKTNVAANYTVRRVCGDPNNPVGVEVQPNFPQHGFVFGLPTIREAIDEAMDMDAARAEEGGGDG